MKRRALIVISLPLVLLALLLLATDLSQAAATGQAATPRTEVTTAITPTELISAPLPQPLEMHIAVRLPITITPQTAGLVAAPPITLAFDLLLHFRVSDTMTSTVPASLMLQLADGITVTLPVSFALGPVTQTVVTAMPVTTSVSLTATEEVTGAEPLTSTPAVTTTPALTATPDVTVTAAVTEAGAGGIPVITAATTVSANLRSGPGTTFPLVETLVPNTPVAIAGVNEAGDWFLLDNGLWIAQFLILNPPANVPLATAQLIEAVNQAAQETAPLPATPTPPTATPPLTPTGTVTVTQPLLLPTPTPTPLAAAAPAAPRVTTDANLRSGPSTDFPIIGGTITGEEIDIIGRNADGTWFLLSNGGWVSAALVENPPTDVQVVPDDATPQSVAQPALPTPTPIPAAEGGTALDLAENVYLEDARNLLTRHDLTVGAITTALNRALADEALLQDATWRSEMATAIRTLRETGQQIRSLEPPPLFAGAHIDLRSATSSYDLAATLAEQGIADDDLTQMQQALAEIEFGNTLVERAEAKLTASTP